MENNFVGNMTDIEIIEWFKSLPSEEMKKINDKIELSKKEENLKKLLNVMEEDFYINLYKNDNNKYEVELSFGIIEDTGIFIEGGQVALSIKDLSMIIKISKELNKLNEEFWEN